MSMTINFDLSDRDLEHFTRLFDVARDRAVDRSNEEIIQAATELLAKAQQSNPPEFVRERLLQLDTLIAMARDEGWALGGEDFAHLRSALVYFAAPADAIPDSVPVLGFLDDAIMIELCARDLHHEIEAYNDFCDFREREAGRHGMTPDAVGRADWLTARREELQDRMHRRRSREGGRGFGTGYGSSSGYARVSRGYSGSGSAWRPGVL